MKETLLFEYFTPRVIIVFNFKQRFVKISVSRIVPLIPIYDRDTVGNISRFSRYQL